MDLETVFRATFNLGKDRDIVSLIEAAVYVASLVQPDKLRRKRSRIIKSLFSDDPANSPKSFSDDVLCSSDGDGEEGIVGLITPLPPRTEEGFGGKFEFKNDSCAKLAANQESSEKTEIKNNTSKGFKKLGADQESKTEIKKNTSKGFEKIGADQKSKTEVKNNTFKGIKKLGTDQESEIEIMNNSSKGFKKQGADRESEIEIKNNPSKDFKKIEADEEPRREFEIGNSNDKAKVFKKAVEKFEVVADDHRREYAVKFQATKRKLAELYNKETEKKAKRKIELIDIPQAKKLICKDEIKKAPVRQRLAANMKQRRN